MSSNPSVESSTSFDVLMRRQGWHVTGSNPTSKVIRWRTKLAAGSPPDDTAFYDAFGDMTVRKVIRSILSAPHEKLRTTRDLAAICPNERRLDEILTYLRAGDIVKKEGAKWSKGANCNRADNIGRTLEWYVAEWFRRELNAPASYGVTVEEMSKGADLDVVAFVGETRVWVECKSSKPEDVSEAQLKGFLQRAFDFRPEIAVLLVDTESSVAKLAQHVRNLWNHMSSLSVGQEPKTAKEEVAEPIPGYTGIHWCARHVYVANVEHSVDRSLSSALRFHESYANRQIYVPTIGKWDFEHGTVQGASEEPYSVEGMVWIRA